MAQQAGGQFQAVTFYIMPERLSHVIGEVVIEIGIRDTKTVGHVFDAEGVADVVVSIGHSLQGKMFQLLFGDNSRF